MKIIAITLALIAGGISVVSTANAGWTGSRLGNMTYWNNLSTGQTVTCSQIGNITYC